MHRAFWIQEDLHDWFQSTGYLPDLVDFAEQCSYIGEGFLEAYLENTSVDLKKKMH